MGFWGFGVLGFWGLGFRFSVLSNIRLSVSGIQENGEPADIR